MLSEIISEPDDYLVHSTELLTKSGVLADYPKISTYYQHLCEAFKDKYCDRSKNVFAQLSELLSVDAQIQILLDLTENTRTDLCKEIGMNEEEIITMIQRDKNYYYRELTGLSVNQEPRWGLIYLSEE
ncbi:hypothetical protein FG877_10405 [Enterococcus casseliflavus]|nr:hypothetical protein [Enterococcus casseliflavus]